MTKNNDYNEITVLKGLEKVRKNFGMYVGNHESGQGLHHLLWEVLDNSVDEYMAGFCSKIVVVLHKNGSCSVEDNGRGIPIKYMKSEKKTALEVALTELHAGGKFSDSKSYNYSGGLHGVGISCVNALSSKLDALVRRNGKEYTISFSKGIKTEDFSERNIRSKVSGTIIRFVPDLSIFKKVIKFDATIIKARLRELSFLCSELSIEFINEFKKERAVFNSQNGLSDFIKELKTSELLDIPLVFTETKNRIFVDISLQWSADSESEICRCYTNNVPNMDGGSHMLGFKTGMTRTINNYINSSDLPKTLKVSLSGDDIREGLVSVVSIRHPDPKFSSQTKDKLVSEDARTAVESVISDKLMRYLEQNPAMAKKIVTSCINAYKAREAARKAREAVRKSSMSSGGLLPGKLADCQERDPDKCELFICEGDSAGGSCKQGRDRRFQAILPLRGKILNVEKSEFRKMMSSEEITNLIKAIGAGIGRTFNPKKIRYGKIILLMDSDVDGAHIRTLLLTFFFRQMPQLIMNGNIYIARPPLFKAAIRGRSNYLLDEKELAVFMNNLDDKTKKMVKLQRYKGLGEMNPGQLWETAMDPEVRSMSQVTIDNPIEADKIFSILMGNQVEPRKDFIIDHALNVSRLDI